MNVLVGKEGSIELMHWLALVPTDIRNADDELYSKVRYLIVLIQDEGEHSYFNLSTATSRTGDSRPSTRNTTISAEEVYQGLFVINRPTRGFARRAVPGSLENACFESGGECISFVDRDCPHQLKAKGFGLCGSVGKSVLEGTKCSSVSQSNFFQCC